MALQTSGPIDISDINVELGNSATTQLNLGSTAARDLAGVSSGAIRLGADFYGKSSVAYFFHWVYRSSYIHQVTSSNIDSNDNIVYGGYSYSGSTAVDGAFVKSYDVDGNLNWQYNLKRSSGYGFNVRVLVDSSDNVYLIWTYDFNRLLVHAFDSAGNGIWYKEYSGIKDMADAAIDTSYIYVVDSQSPIAVLKLNASNGDFVSGKYSSYTSGYGGNYYYPRSIAISSTGKILITGKRYYSYGNETTGFMVELNSNYSINSGYDQIKITSPYGNAPVNNFGDGVVSAGYINGTTAVTAFDSHLAQYSGDTSSRWGWLASWNTGASSATVTNLKKVSENSGSFSRLKTVGNNLYGSFTQNSPVARSCFVKLSSTLNSSGGYNFTSKDLTGASVSTMNQLHAGGESSTGFWVFGGGKDRGGLYKAATDYSSAGSYDGGKIVLGTSNTIASASSYIVNGSGGFSWPMDQNLSVSVSTATIGTVTDPFVSVVSL